MNFTSNMIPKLDEANASKSNQLFKALTKGTPPKATRNDSSTIIADDDSWSDFMESQDLHNIDSKDNLELLKTNGITDILMSTKFSRGRATLPTQAEAVPYLKYLILVPIAQLALMTLSATVWIPIMVKTLGGAAGVDAIVYGLIHNKIFATLLLIAIVYGTIKDMAGDIATFVMLRRGQQRVNFPASCPRLTHAVVVCQYKEPIEILSATIESLAANTVAEMTIIVIASEARDPDAVVTFQTLRSKFGHQFLDFFMTAHTIQPGEVAGKSSNENWAVRQLYDHVQQRDIDPYKVMVTVCDADSLFDNVFLEQVEGEFWRQPDGRRFIYNSPINTHRNLPACNPLVMVFEQLRCQSEAFANLEFLQVESNYSLTLGFAHDIDYWDPTNTSEDYHMMSKVMASTGAGKNVVVKVWSLILNDSVCSIQDRWVQAKRHMWGIEEVAWAFSLYPHLRVNHWLEIFSMTSKRLLTTTTVPPTLILAFPQVFRVIFALRPETKYMLLLMLAAGFLYGFIKNIIRELLVYHWILKDRKHFMKCSYSQWAIRLGLVGNIVLAPISTFLFSTCATWAMLFRALRSDSVVYVTAPKALHWDTNNNSNEDERTKSV
jgi:hypothetical protein